MYNYKVVDVKLRPCAKENVQDLTKIKLNEKCATRFLYNECCFPLDNHLS